LLAPIKPVPLGCRANTKWLIIGSHCPEFDKKHLRQTRPFAVNDFDNLATVDLPHLPICCCKKQNIQKFPVEPDAPNGKAAEIQTNINKTKPRKHSQQTNRLQRMIAPLDVGVAWISSALLFGAEQESLL